MDLRNIDIREEYYKDVHNMKPSWWMQWSISVVLAIVIIIFLLGYAVKYPDIINCEVAIRTNSPCVTLSLPQGAQIEDLLVANNARVARDSALLVVKNSASYHDVIALDDAIQKFSFDKESIIKFFDVFIDKNLQLGNLIENDWIAFSNELLNFYKVEKLGSYRKQIEHLDKEIVTQKHLLNEYKMLLKNDEQQKRILNEKIKTDSTLYAKKVTSRLEYHTNTQIYLAKKTELEQNRLTIERTKLEITKLENARQSFQNTEDESVVTQRLAMHKAFGKLKSAIDTWKKSFMIIAPISGKVSFLQNLEPNKFFEGKALVLIPDSSNYYGAINIPITGAGKAKIGQHIIVKLSDYPYKEYGVLEGTLTELAAVPNEKFYIGKIRFGQQLSNYMKKVVLKENMSGVGELITNDRNLLDRLFETVFYAFRKR